MARDPLTIWTITDGKAGHANQVRGLLDGIARRVEVRAVGLDARRAGRVLGRFPKVALEGLAAPDLILCAGRLTHRPALGAKRAVGGRVVVCMRPSVRARDFDLCLIPRHDRAGEAANVVETTGALVNVRPSDGHDAKRGVFLIGGESKHHGVDERGLVRRVGAIVARSPGVSWELTTSRRTPAGAAAGLRGIGAANLRVFEAGETEAGWVGERLAAAGRAWVTEDSVSMVCEAVTAGARVGVLPMPRVTERSRVAWCVDDLVRGKYAMSYAEWETGKELREAAGTLDEADRCAGVVVERFFGDGG